MRCFVWFAIGFTAACAAAVYLFVDNWLLLAALLLLSISLLTLIGSNAAVRVVRLACLGCAAAFFWVWIFNQAYVADIAYLDGETICETVEITDFSSDTDWGIRADGKIKLEGKTYKIRLYSSDIHLLRPGDRLTGKLRLRCTLGGNEERTYHSGNGLFLLGYLGDDVTVLAAEDTPLRYFPAVLRMNIVALLEAAFPEDTYPFVCALLLGERSLLDYQTNTDLSVSGIRHVVAVSGLHVSILFSILIMLFGYRRVITPLVGWPLLLIFAAVTGFTPSVVRACIMHAIMLGGMMLQKEYDSPTALAVAVLVMLTANPYTVTSIGFQLSVGCLVGIFLFSGRIRQFLLSDKCLGKSKANTRKGKLKNWIAGSVSATLSTLITTMPLSAAYFGTVSLVGVLTNLLTLWLVTFIFCGILAVCVIGTLYLPAAQFFAWVLSWPIRFVLWVAHALASVPMAAVYTKSIYVVLWIVFCYVLLGVSLLSKKKHPWVMAFCVLAGLVVSVGASWLEPKLDHYRLSVLDVGQGQCILIQNEGKYYMVDCGGDTAQAAADTAVQTLLSQGVNHLDGIILTHYDVDHAGGVGYVLSRISVDKLYLQDLPGVSDIKQQLFTAYPDKITLVSPESITEIEDVPITLYTTGIQKTDNESSMCVLFQPENCDILITGDRSASGERALLKQVSLPDLEVLVVGHHGAKGSACLELLTQTMPEAAVISVGRDNTYGHPSSDVLERLALFGCDVLRTDLQGTITIRG